MTEYKHTPTPWKINPLDDTEIVAFEQHKKPHELLICRMGEGDLGDHDADAAFIVRAVNAFEIMQKALLEVQEDYRELLRACPEKDKSDEINKMLEIVDNAISISKGE